MNLRKCKTCMHTPHVQHILMHTDNQLEINGMQKNNAEIAWRGDSPGIRKQASVPFSNMDNRMHTVIAPLYWTHPEVVTCSGRPMRFPTPSQNGSGRNGKVARPMLSPERFTPW